MRHHHRPAELRRRRRPPGLPGGSPFRVSSGKLSGTRGAVGFTVTAAAPVRELRDALRAATLPVCPGVPVSRYEIVPHVTIVYGNTNNVPAADAIAVVEKLNASEPSLKPVSKKQSWFSWNAASALTRGKSSRGYRSPDTPALRRSSRTAGYFAFLVRFKPFPRQQASAWEVTSSAADGSRRPKAHPGKQVGGRPCAPR